ncbi:MAG: ATP-binding protein [Chloroflexi bacterium]|nr:ATP-binding protein [Chloroflexota bacterium]
MPRSDIVDRGDVLRTLDEAAAARGGSLILVYGRRRLGKTFLLREWAEGRRHLYFQAAESTSVESLDALRRELAVQLKDPLASSDALPTWRVLIGHLAELARNEPLIVVLDEFSYLLTAVEDLAAIIQSVWDAERRRCRLKLILAGSEIGTMRSLDDRGQPLHGRFDHKLHIEPLDYARASEFLGGAPWAAAERLRLYGVFGGAGRYLDEIDPRKTLRENIQRLVLDPGATFRDEGRAIIREERRVRDYGNYNAVLQAIARGHTKLEDIRTVAGTGNVTSEALDRLQAFSWVEHETPFQQPKRRGLYRITDNFLLFWYRLIFPNRSALQRLRPNTFWSTFIAPDLDGGYMGQRVFERLCRQYLDRYGEGRGLIIRDMGRWWAPDNDPEIDIVAELDKGYLCAECKWSKRPVGPEVLGALPDKVRRAKDPPWRRKAQPRLALFSLGGFKRELVDAAANENVPLVSGDDFFR